MREKLCISKIISNLVVFKTLSSNIRMHNLYANFVKIFEICKRFSKKLVNERGGAESTGKCKIRKNV